MNPWLKLLNDLALTPSDFAQYRRIKNWMMSDLLVSQRTAVFNVCMDLIC